MRLFASRGLLDRTGFLVRVLVIYAAAKAIRFGLYWVPEVGFDLAFGVAPILEFAFYLDAIFARVRDLGLGRGWAVLMLLVWVFFEVLHQTGSPQIQVASLIVFWAALVLLLVVPGNIFREKAD